MLTRSAVAPLLKRIPSPPAYESKLFNLRELQKAEDAYFRFVHLYEEVGYPASTTQTNVYIRPRSSTIQSSYILNGEGFHWIGHLEPPIDIEAHNERYKGRSIIIESRNISVSFSINRQSRHFDKANELMRFSIMAILDVDASIAEDLLNQALEGMSPYDPISGTSSSLGVPVSGGHLYAHDSFYSKDIHFTLP